MDFSAIKRLFEPEPRRMSRLVLDIRTPLPAVSYCYEIQHAAESKRITGRINLNMDGTMKMLLEGAFDELNELLTLLSAGKIVPTRLIIESMWLTYKNEFNALTVQVFHQIQGKARAADESSSHADHSWRMKY